MRLIRIALGFVCLVFSAGAVACMESHTDNAGTWITNDCGKGVSYSFCFGTNCTPASEEHGTMSSVRGIQSKKQISMRQHAAVNFNYCFLPKRVKNGGCS